MTPQVPQSCEVCAQYGCSAPHRCGAWLSRNVRCPTATVAGTYFCTLHALREGGHHADGS